MAMFRRIITVPHSAIYFPGKRLANSERAQEGYLDLHRLIYEKKIKPQE